jgi:hypothetical protein
VRAFKDRPGRGFVLSHTPVVLARLKAEEDARRRETNEWARRLDRAIDSSVLSQADRNAVWRHVKSDHPETRAFLEDPQVQHLVRTQGAIPVFPPELVLAARRQAKEVTTK